MVLSPSREKCFFAAAMSLAADWSTWRHTLLRLFRWPFVGWPRIFGSSTKTTPPPCGIFRCSRTYHLRVVPFIVESVRDGLTWLTVASIINSVACITWSDKYNGPIVRSLNLLNLLSTIRILAPFDVICRQRCPHCCTRSGASPDTRPLPTTAAAAASTRRASSPPFSVKSFFQSLFLLDGESIWFF